MDFYVHFAARGDVVGLGLGSRAEEWVEKLGADFREGPLHDDRLGRGFGPIDVSFRNDTGEWLARHISVQVRKLV
ncbi:hypothetical protein [Amycolatopsis sp. H20-H5]|uniref:hypothetical protein n=1 Tax=Amycolatopsis sp. H20-H5 TaxID=3046309 RepID=UPI002DB66BC6|nr:hypothetical protein [Amycolatopsis sp. H20-H5]MEC3977791.1 hypothetical protein [Amycolatopsis sp. H20-H5]